MLRLPPFRYHRPDTVQDAVSLLAEYAESAIPVSGGTDLIPNMKHRLFTPAHLVALKGIGELKGIREKDGELVIGAAETLTDVSLHPSVRLHFTALSEAAGRVAGPQLRNSGTLGGNLCLDSPFVADGIWNTIREPGEIVTRIRMPLPEPELRTAYVKLRQRQSIDFPLLTVAVAADVDPENRLRSLRGVVTALGARPKELTGWEELAEGEVVTDEFIGALAERAFRQCHPLENLIGDAEWRRAMVPVHVTRALRKLRKTAGTHDRRSGGVARRSQRDLRLSFEYGSVGQPRTRVRRREHHPAAVPRGAPRPRSDPRYSEKERLEHSSRDGYEGASDQTLEWPGRRRQGGGDRDLLAGRGQVSRAGELGRRRG